MMATDSDDDVILNEQIEIIEIEDTDDDYSGEANNLPACKTVRQPPALATNKQKVTKKSNQFVFGKEAKRIPIYSDTVEHICTYFHVRLKPGSPLEDIRKQFREKTNMRKNTPELRNAIARNGHCFCRVLLVKGLPCWFEMYHVITLLRLMSSFNVNKPYYYISMATNKTNRSTKTVGCYIRFLNIEDCRQVLYDMQGLQHFGNEITVEIDMGEFYQRYTKKRSKKTLECIKVFRQNQLYWIPDRRSVSAVEIYDSEEKPGESYCYPLLVDINKNFKQWCDPVDEIIQQIEKEYSTEKENNASTSEACKNKNASKSEVCTNKNASTSEVDMCADPDLSGGVRRLKIGRRRRRNRRKIGVGISEACTNENASTSEVCTNKNDKYVSSKNGEHKVALNSYNEDLKYYSSKHDDEKLQGEDKKLTFKRKLSEDGPLGNKQPQSKKPKVEPSASTSFDRHPDSSQSMSKATLHPNVNQNKFVNQSIPTGYTGHAYYGNHFGRNNNAYNPNPYAYHPNPYFNNNFYQNPCFAPNNSYQNPYYAPNNYYQNPNMQNRTRDLNPVAPRKAGKKPKQKNPGKKKLPPIKCEKGDKPHGQKNLVIKKEVSIKTEYQNSQTSDMSEQIIIKKEPADFQGDRFQQECSKIKQDIKKEHDF